MNNDYEKIIFAQKIIQKKLVGKKLAYKEIYHLIDLISKQKISDVLIAYFTAASFTNKTSDKEIFYLIKAMVETGKRLSFKGIVADKHSIGGVAGTCISPIVVAIVAADGFKIPKISSRAIITPAGTADVMEVLAKVDLNLKEIERVVNTTGGCLVWNGKMGVVPADNVIIKVEKQVMFQSFDKIIISILAKKIAAGSNIVILDIPYGPDLKIKKKSEAKIILKKFTELGKKFGLDIVGEISKVEAPLGQGIGPALEAKEVLKILEQDEGRCFALEKKAINIAAKLIERCYQRQRRFHLDSYRVATEILTSGKALKKFREIVKYQFGNPNITSIDLKLGKIRQLIRSDKKGIIKKVNISNLSNIAKILGAPQIKTAGIYLFKNQGDEIEKNEPMMEFYAEGANNLNTAQEISKKFLIFEIE